MPPIDPTALVDPILGIVAMLLVGWAVAEGVTGLQLAVTRGRAIGWREGRQM